jgi:hypothetical protein
MSMYQRCIQLSELKGLWPIVHGTFSKHERSIKQLGLLLQGARQCTSWRWASWTVQTKG